MIPWLLLGNHAFVFQLSTHRHLLRTTSGGLERAPISSAAPMAIIDPSHLREIYSTPLNARQLLKIGLVYHMSDNLHVGFLRKPCSSKYYELNVFDLHKACFQKPRSPP